MYQQYRPSQFSNFPPVVKNLLIINGLCFLANIVLGNKGWYDVNGHLGLFFPASPFFRPFQFFTHVFMHADFNHLLMNMFSLWMFGRNLENFWGPKRFFIYYFITAFGSALLYLGVNALEIYQIKQTIAQFAMSPNYDTFFTIIQDYPRLANNSYVIDFLDMWKADPKNPEIIEGAKLILGQLYDAKMAVPMVGASGAIFGLLIGYGLLFPNSEIIMLFFPFPIKAKYFVTFFALLELYQGIANNPSDNVAHFAHLGGMLFGFIMIKFWNKTNRSNFY